MDTAYGIAIGIFSYGRDIGGQDVHALASRVTVGEEHAGYGDVGDWQDAGIDEDFIDSFELDVSGEEIEWVGGTDDERAEIVFASLSELSFHVDAFEGDHEAEVGNFSEFDIG